MPVLGLHCSHEQVRPRALLAAVQQAEAAGFDAAMSSDHFSPWSSRQGHSAFAWSWLGAALPGHRYTRPDTPPLLVGAAVSEATAAWCAQYAELGFDKIFLHHVGQEQEAFVDALGQKVLPQLRSAA